MTKDSEGGVGNHLFGIKCCARISASAGKVCVCVCIILSVWRGQPRLYTYSGIPATSPGCFKEMKSELIEVGKSFIDPVFKTVVGLTAKRHTPPKTSPSLFRSPYSKISWIFLMPMQSTRRWCVGGVSAFVKRSAILSDPGMWLTRTFSSWI